MKNTVVDRDIPWDKVIDIGDHSTIKIHTSFRKAVPSLGKQLLEPLVRDIFPVAAKAFSIKQSEAFYADVWEHVTEADMLAVCAMRGRTVGFAAVKDLEELDTFFLHGVAINSDFHKSGIASSIVGALLEESDRRRIAFTTQNPKMFCLLRKKAKLCFPSPDRQRVPDDESQYGTMLMSGRSGVFNPSTFVSANLYSNCLYPTIQPCGDEKVDRWFWESLEIKDGQTRHGFLLCGER